MNYLSSLILQPAALVAHVRLPLYRNAYALMLSTAATSGLGLVYWMVAARYYPADLVGVNAAMISLLTFLAGLAQLPFMNAMLRFIPAAGIDTRRLVGRAYLISIALAAGIGLTFLASVDFWSPALNFLVQDGWLALWFVVGVVAWCVFALQDNVLTGLRAAIYVPLENIPYAVVKIGLLVILAGSFTTNWPWHVDHSWATRGHPILASWTWPLLVILLPVNYFIFSRLIPRHMRAADGQGLAHTVGQIVYYMGGNSLGALFLLAATRLLPLLVTNQAGALATAYFFLPWMIATSLKLITANMTTSFTVEVATDITKLQAYSLRFVAHTAAILIAPILLIVAAAPLILSVSGPDYAAEGAQLLRLLSLTAIPNILTSLYLGIARVRQQVAGIILVQGAFCVLTLGLSYWLLPQQGILGVGMAVLIAETFLAVALLLTRLWPVLGAPVALWLIGKDRS